MNSLILKMAPFLLLTTFIFGDEFPFEPPKNFTLNPKYIALHHPVTTKQAAAQLYFDQGLTLSYAFNHDASYWSFYRAVELDPEFAMGYWGMAMAMGPNINMDVTGKREAAAFNAIQKALQYSKELPANEQDYIKAMAKRYSDVASPDLKMLSKQYSDAMKGVMERYPDDPDASIMYAESLLDLNPWNQWNADGTPAPGTQDAINALENVLKNDPESLGGNHFYIHVLEASTHPEYALMSANRLRTLMPASGHILHMPSHIYLLLGDYRQAALANEQAAAVDKEYIQDYGVSGIYPVHYLTHNLYFMSRAYSMMGRFNDAYEAAEELEKLYIDHFHRMPELEYYAPTKISVLLRFHKWNDILKVPPPSHDMKMTDLIWHFARAIAFASLGNLTQAQDEQKLFLEGKSRMPADEIYGYNMANKIVAIADDLLNAKLAEVQNNISEAIEQLKRAVAVQDTLKYNEPPDWFFPVRESLGGLLLQNKLYKDAEPIFRQDLKLHPRNGRSLFGLKEALGGQNRDSDKFWIDTEFQKAWMYADTPLNIKDL